MRFAHMLRFGAGLLRYRNAVDRRGYPALYHSRTATFRRMYTMMGGRKGFLCGVAVAMLPLYAGAADTKSLGEFGAWRAFSYSESGQKVCYVSASADQVMGGDKGRKPTFLLVTHRPNDPGQISVNGPWGFKRESEVELQVGAMKNTLFTKGEFAWTKQQGADKGIVVSMLKGRDVVVRSNPVHGSAITDKISLDGFAKALATIDKDCGVKR